MKRICLIAVLIISFLGRGQNLPTYQNPPVFSPCAETSFTALKACFNANLNRFIFENYEVPKIVKDQDYIGNIQILFEVNETGEFTLIYIDAIYEALKIEMQRVFSLLPKIKPAMYNGQPTFMQYSLTIAIPLLEPSTGGLSTINTSVYIDSSNVSYSNEYDKVNKAIQPYQQLAYESQLNVPFTHAYYARFDAAMNVLGTNSHTAAKPYVYSEVKPYYDIKAAHVDLAKAVTSWWGKKLYNEHLVEVQGKDYWFTIDPVFDLQIGSDTEADYGTWNNTRGVFIQGGLGNKLSFSTSFFESQGRFAAYYNRYAESLGKPNSDTEIAVIPGRGIAKRFKQNSYDYPVAEGYLSYAPSTHFNVQFGHGKNFIGDGYRSLLQSDVTNPYTYVKLNTNFWKIKYTNTWMWLRDIRPEVEQDGAFLTKYMANHYLSWNVSKRLNIGLFESVMWVDSNGRGFDINYLNPIIFFRAIEFETGQDAGNAVLGASAKYKWNNSVNLYGQFILDEFSLGDIKAGDKSWKNKYGYQLGIKYFNAFKVPNLLLQIEYNQVRPYTYSHNSIVLNYAHANQSMAHLWGANFKELLIIGRYNYKRWFADAKLSIGKRGLDFNTVENDFSYGGDIYRSEEDRPFNNNVTIGQGNETSSFMSELQAGYVLNPQTNLKLFTNLIFRDFNPNAVTPNAAASSTFWFSVGVRTDLFNWYNDF